MRKRLLSLFLVGAMVSGLLIGCGSKQEPVTESKPSSSDVAKEEDISKESEEKELTTIKILCKNDFDATTKTENWKDYPVSDVVIADLAEIGIELELECIDNSSFESVVNTRMASNTDVPDLIAYTTWSSEGDKTVLEWGKNGLVYDLAELVEQYDEDGSIKAYYESKVPGAWQRTTTPDGAVYWFSQLSGPNVAYDIETGELVQRVSQYGLSIRKDWVEAVGEEWKDVWTPDELFAVLKKMQDQDVNGNGAADEVLSIGIDHFYNGIAQGFGLTCQTLGGYYENDNKVFSNFYHENFPAYIKFMNSLYENGLYDTIRLSCSDDQLISENRAIGAYSYAAWDFEMSLPEIEEGVDYYRYIVIDQDGDLTNGFPCAVDNFKGTIYNNFFIPKASKNAEAVIRLMDYVYSERYATLNQLGIEGDGYEINEDGLYVTLPNRSKNFVETSAGLNALPAVAGPVTAVSFKPDPNDSRPGYMQRKDEFAGTTFAEVFKMTDQYEFPNQTLAMMSDEEEAFVNEKSEMLNTYATELLVDLILGNKSIDDLPKYQAELDKLGLQEYLDILQARRDRVLNAN